MKFQPIISMMLMQVAKQNVVAYHYLTYDPGVQETLGDGTSAFWENALTGTVTSI